VHGRKGIDETINETVEGIKNEGRFGHSLI
jgi:hypothetical protein